MLLPGLQHVAHFKTGQPDSKPANLFQNRLANFTQAWSMQHVSVIVKAAVMMSKENLVETFSKYLANKFMIRT